jgi:4-hydroxy-2-oxoglutarate aldolase
MDKKLMGVFAPITTPFDENENVSYEQLKENVEFYAGTKLNGYLALGSNGENKSLNNKEKEMVLKTIIENKGDHQTVMAGCIFESTKETIEFARIAEEMGADYITLLSPSYFSSSMTDEVLLRYFTDVADAVNIPCLLYNAPQFCAGVILSAELAEKCAKHPNITGMKDSSKGNIEMYCTALKDKMNVMSGSANTFVDCLRLGGTGGIISLANVFPDITCELYESFCTGQHEKTEELNKKVLRMNKEVSGSGGVAAVKYAMDLAGLHGGNPRRPLLPLDEEKKRKLKSFLESEGMI